MLKEFILDPTMESVRVETFYLEPAPYFLLHNVGYGKLHN